MSYTEVDLDFYLPAENDINKFLLRYDTKLLNIAINTSITITEAKHMTDILNNIEMLSANYTANRKQIRRLCMIITETLKR